MSTDLLFPAVKRATWPVASALAALALAGCGSGHSSIPSASSATTAATTTDTRTNAPLIDIPVSVPVLKRVPGAAPLPSRYTCDGADVSPPISWANVPPGTAEIALFISSVESETEYTEWAVAGLSPGVRSLVSGHLPAGAIVGRNRSGRLGYSICPRKGTTTHYYVLLFPLPRKLTVGPGFDPQSLAQSVVHMATHEGQAYFTYKRP
jgi:phosphatidylethanolamine-binding protein (PEBP) family uncharacterized protein